MLRLAKRKPMNQAYQSARAAVPVQRDARDFQAAARHSRTVRLLKIGIPVAGALLIGIFGAMTVFSDTNVPDVAIDLTSSSIKDGKIVMANPRMNGFTKDGKPYRMQAERALQQVSDTSEIALEKIGATVPFRGEATANIAADSAVYNSQKQTLLIDKPFTVVSTDGLKATLESAFVELEGGALTTDRPVSIELNGTRITADSMKVLERGKVLVFTNKVRLNISPGTVKTVRADSPEAANEGSQP